MIIEKHLRILEKEIQVLVKKKKRGENGPFQEKDLFSIGTDQRHHAIISFSIYSLN